MGNSSGIVCPRCDSYTVRRVQRSFLEKLLSRKRKYRCCHCKKKFFRESCGREVLRSKHKIY